MNAMLAQAEAEAVKAGVFGTVSRDAARLKAAAKGAADEAFYVIYQDSGGTWVALQTPGRYLSQSIEADLVFTGDKLEDLIHEELVDLGYEGPPIPCEHFRDDAKLYTFRCKVPQAEEAGRLLLAFEACFRRLGDMESGEE
ncbi:MAG: hypothetical protein WC718_03725 [Phycisphaerales bacterium]